MATATSGFVTLEEFARLRDDEHTFELSEGELVQITFPTAGHTVIAKRIARSMEHGRTSTEAGEAYIEAGFLLQEQPPILRRPDVAFVAREHLERTDLGEWFRGAPSIAVEVVSPSETASDLNRKVRQYLGHGASAVMAVYPESREIHL
jgi:Uma2 family endonuclease